jgi:segregation and condensation protein B
MAFNLKQVLKALLFSSSQPLTVKEIQEILTRFHEQGGADLLPRAEGPNPAADPGADAAAGTAREAAEPANPSAADAELYADVPALITTAQIREATDEIARELRAADDVMLLTEGAQGFRFATHPRFARWVRVLRNEPPPVKLSQTAMETLAVIAYRQPVTRAEIEHIRGVSAEAGLNKLLERELIYVVGRADLPGRPIQYGTTEAFLEFVGIRSLDELPATDVLSRQQINDWLQNAMRATHPSDRDMGLSEEGEEQLSLDDAARTAKVEKAAAATSAPAAEEPSPTPGTSDPAPQPAAPIGPV